MLTEKFRLMLITSQVELVFSSGSPQVLLRLVFSSGSPQVSVLLRLVFFRLVFFRFSSG